jgi:hypothetical protein
MLLMLLLQRQMLSCNACLLLWDQDPEALFAQQRFACLLAEQKMMKKKRLHVLLHPQVADYIQSKAY